MARTRKTGSVEDLLELGAALPWWQSLVLAAAAYGISLRPSVLARAALCATAAHC